MIWGIWAHFLHITTIPKYLKNGYNSTFSRVFQIVVREPEEEWFLTIRTFAKARKTIKYQLKSELPWPVYPKSITWKLLFSAGIDFCWVGGMQGIKIWWGKGESTESNGDKIFTCWRGSLLPLSPPPPKPCPALAKPCLLGLGTRVRPYFIWNME